jgi:hypothetical protein
MRRALCPLFTASASRRKLLDNASIAKGDKMSVFELDTRPPRVIKKPTAEAVRAVPFDSELALTETRNFSRLLNLHLARCNDSETATKIAAILATQAQAFANKALDINSKLL